MNWVENSVNYELEGVSPRRRPNKSWCEVCRKRFLCL